VKKGGGEGSTESVLMGCWGVFCGFGVGGGGGGGVGFWGGGGGGFFVGFFGGLGCGVFGRVWVWFENGLNKPHYQPTRPTVVAAIKKLALRGGKKPLRNSKGKCLKESKPFRFGSDGRKKETGKKQSKRATALGRRGSLPRW